MKTLKFRIPNTLASIEALITALEYQASLMDDNVIVAPGAVAIADKVVELKKSETSAPAVPASGATAVKTVAPEGVDVDSEGLPWDARIHAASKKTLARGGTWKLKRGIDDALVESVKTELRATMAAAPAVKIDYEAESNEIEKQAAAESTIAPPPPLAPAPAPAPEADPIYITPDGGEHSANKLLQSGWSSEQIATLPVKQVVNNVTTFPELMAAITAAGLDEASILAAVNKSDIQALPLLAARPDLIPTVYAELFPA